MDNRSQRLDALKEVTRQIDIIYRNVFSTPEGRKVLEDLNKRFNPEVLSTENPHTTALRVGESTPVRYIERRVKDGMVGKPVG